MRTDAILGLAIFLAMLGAETRAQPIPPERIPRVVNVGVEFRTRDDFLRWTAGYYSDPQPREIHRAFVYFLDSGLLNDEARRMPIAAFFGAVMREHPDLAEAMRLQAVARNSYEPVIAFANSLWLTNADWAREKLRDMAASESNEQVREFLTRRAQSASPIAEGREIRSLAQINTIWGEFGATGSPRVAERIAEVLLIEFEASPDALILQQAAEQSLRLRAKEHGPVREGIRAAIDKASPSPRRDRLEAFLTEMSPGQPD